MKIELETLKPLFRSAFDDKDLDITLDSDKNNIASWDSMGHLNLVIEVEDSLGISFTKDEIENFTSVREIIQIIESK